MGFFDSLMGRSRPKRASLDSLFLIPSAAITLETGLGFSPTGSGSVCYREAQGAAAVQTRDEIVALLNSDADGPDVVLSTDDYGFTWLTSEQTDMSVLCTDLHAVNSTLEERGFGGGLLCSLVPFADASGRRVGLVYLYKQGTFYPFAPHSGHTARESNAPSPQGPQQRDNLLEIQVRDALAAELPMEKELSRWFAVWGAPGL